MDKIPHPPHLLLRFFRWFCHPDLVKYIEGDLIELFETNVKEKGLRKAKWMFVWDVMRLFRPSIIRPTEGNYRLNNYGMFKNYFKVGIRNIVKYKVFSFINVFGLAVAMSVCMLIMLMIADQMAYDQFHEKKDKTYRIIGHIDDSILPYASTAFPLAGSLKTEYTIVEGAVTLRTGVGGDLTYDNRTQETRGFFTTSDFFEVFSFKLEKGDEKTALSAPNSVVITSDCAQHLFEDEDPIGKTVRLIDRGLDHLYIESNGNTNEDWELFTVTGVMDNQAYKSHLKFDVLVSSSSLKALYASKKLHNLSNDWLRFYECYTYVVLNSRANEEELNAALTSLVADKYAGVNDPPGIKLTGQALGDISPGPFMAIPIGLRMPIEAYYILGFFALVIMALACLNYTNLSTARALTRAKEIGVRKVSGGSRMNLIFQFMSESMIMSFFALLVAFLILIFVKASFVNLWINTYFDFDLQASLPVYLIFVAFTVAIGLISGIYPALYLSKLAPLKVLKNIGSLGPKKIGIRKVLNVSQFAVSLLFIITSIVIYNQVKHFLQFEYGFGIDNIVNIELQGNDYQLVSNEFSSVPGVNALSACSVIPASGSGEGQFLKTWKSEEEYLLFSIFYIDDKFVDNLDLKLVAGINLLISGKQADQHILINRSAAKKLGYESPAEAIGSYLEFKNEGHNLRIGGVIDDFQFKSLWENERDVPLILLNNPEKFGYLNLKTDSNKAIATLGKLEEKWKGLDAIHPFKYEFLDDQLASMNALFEDVVAIIGFITFLSIVISCLGLFGMSIYTIERRTKEIGIRKVLGAKAYSIALFVSKEFILLLGVSVIIAAPLSYILNNLWLANFPNSVDFGVGTVLIGSALLLILGLVTIASHTIKAANRNPIESLRDE